MRIFRNKLTVITISFLAIIIIAGVFIWQYSIYEDEAARYKSEIYEYEANYLKDKNKLEGKTVDELLNMIKAVKTELEGAYRILPRKNYLNLYNYILAIRQSYDNHNVDFLVEDIENEEWDFYEIVTFSAILDGNQENINKAIMEMIDRNKLININDICLRDKTDSNNVRLGINFNAYLYIDEQTMEKKHTRPTIADEEKEIKTWLPPLSFKLRAYRERSSDLKKLETTRNDLKEKLGLFEEYKNNLETLHKLEIIIDHLIDPNKTEKFQGIQMDLISKCESP